MKTASENRWSAKLFILYMTIAAAVVFADRLTKSWIRENLQLNETIPLIDGIFHITHVRNFGAAFSILPNQKLFFIVVTFAVSLALIFIIATRAGRQSALLLLSLSLILGGGVGNLIDRISLGFVTDFFDFRAINFAIFNVADIAVVCGAGLLLFYMFFIDMRRKQDGTGGLFQ